MQLSPHLSSAIGGFLLMADTASPSIPARETGRVTVGAGRVGVVQCPCNLWQAADTLGSVANQVTNK